MFLIGSGVRKVARFHEVAETQVEAEIRERMILAGELNRMRKAA